MTPPLDVFVKGRCVHCNGNLRWDAELQEVNCLMCGRRVEA